MFTRNDELAQSHQLLAEAHESKGRIALVSAAAGTGKTTLLRTFAQAADNSGCVVMSASCARAEKSLPLGMLAQLFDDPTLPLDVAARASELLLSRQHAHVRPLEPNSQAQDAICMQGLTRVMHELATSHTVVLCVDDVHHADSDSVDYLLHLLRRLHSTRILTMLTERTQCTGPYSPLRTELLRQPHVRPITLAPLTQEGVTKMVGSLENSETSRAVGAAYHDLTGGNPLLVRALLQDREAGRPPLSGPTGGADEARKDTRRNVGPRAGARLGAPPQPDGDTTVFGSTVLSCLHSSDPLVIDITRGLALLEDAFSRTVLTRLLRATRDDDSASITQEAVARVVHYLNATGLLEGTRFRHPATASVVLADMAPRDRAHWHYEAALLLHDTSAPATLVAHHLLGADDAPSAWMPGLLTTAADELLLEDRVETARACLDLAYRSSAGDQQRATIRASLAAVEWRIAPMTATRRLPELRAALQDGHLSGFQALHVFEELLWQGLLPTTPDLKKAFEALGGEDSPRLRAEWRTTRLLLAHTFPGLSPKSVDSEDQDASHRDAALATGCRLKAISGLSVVLANGPDETAVAAAEQLLSTTRLSESTFQALAVAMCTLLYADRLRAAEYWSEQLLSEADKRGGAHWAAVFACIRGDAALRLGDLPLAEQSAQSALVHVPPEAWGIALAGPHSILLSALTEGGRYDEAAELLSRPVPDAAFESTLGLPYLHARGQYYMRTRQYESALADFTVCGELMRGWQLDQPHLLPWRSSAAECLLRLGSREAAEQLAEEQLALLLPGQVSGPRGVSLRVLAAASPLERRFELLNEAIEVLQHCGRRLDLARALTDLGEAHQAVGEVSRASIAARKSQHLVDECQSARPEQSALTVSIRDEPPRLPPDAERLEQLSEAERRVGALAAQGRTNREIASKLCITVSTVEQHLTRVYRKLSVKRRKDLPAGLQTPVVGSHTLATCDTLLTTTPASREASLLRRQPDVRTTHVRPPVPSLSEVGRRIPS